MDIIDTEAYQISAEILTEVMRHDPSFMRVQGENVWWCRACEISLGVYKPTDIYHDISCQHRVEMAIRLSFAKASELLANSASSLTLTEPGEDDDYDDLAERR